MDRAKELFLKYNGSRFHMDRFSRGILDRAEKGTLSRSEDYDMQEFSDSAHVSDYLNGIRKKWTGLL